MPLEVLLDRFALDEKVRGEVIAPEEEREHRRGRQPTRIGRPDNVRERVSMCLMHDGGARFRESGHVEADRLECPSRGSVTPCEPAPDILVWIDEHGETHVPCHLDDLLDVVQVLGIVELRARVLDR
ncbi:MAG: hypothetical protein NTW63_07420, partial [Caldiserica bacterium]|nr:hypothetical protein [Caldisericota bacterium]